LHAEGGQQLDYIACDGSVVIAVGGTRTISQARDGRAPAPSSRRSAISRCVRGLT
jgi:hypothetical protein